MSEGINPTKVGDRFRVVVAGPENGATTADSGSPTLPARPVLLERPQTTACLEQTQESEKPELHVEDNGFTSIKLPLAAFATLAETWRGSAESPPLYKKDELHITLLSDRIVGEDAFALFAQKLADLTTLIDSARDDGLLDFRICEDAKLLRVSNHKATGLVAPVEIPRLGEFYERLKVFANDALKMTLNTPQNCFPHVTLYTDSKESKGVGIPNREALSAMREVLEQDATLSSLREASTRLADRE